MDIYLAGMPELSDSFLTFYEDTSGNIGAKSVDRRDVKKCRICRNACENIRILQCGDTFCKPCLKSFVSKLQCVRLIKSFKCPNCRQDIEAPNLPVSKWMKAFKVDKRTQFYSTFPEPTCNTDVKSSPSLKVPKPSQPLSSSSDKCKPQKSRSAFIPGYCDSKGLSETCSKKNTKRSRAASERPRIMSRNDVMKKGTRRTAVHFHGYDYYGAFDSRISTDQFTCQYWSGDVSPSGEEIVLADWRNGTVKLFNSSGQFLSSLSRLPCQPLFVTFLNDGVIILTFGGRGRTAMFLMCIKDEKTTQLCMWNEKSWKGYLYATARCEENCLVISERTDGFVCVLQLIMHEPCTETGTVKARFKVLCLDDKVEVSTNSSIFYCHHSKTILLTEKTTLYCLNINGQLLHQHQYLLQDTQHYNLGSVTTCSDGSIMVASDLCILKLNKAGDLVTVIPTKLDPYCLISAQLDKRFLLLGRNDQVDVIVLKE